jgi:hypothetical protein
VCVCVSREIKIKKPPNRTLSNYFVRRAHISHFAVWRKLVVWNTEVEMDGVEGGRRRPGRTKSRDWNIRENWVEVMANL